MAIAEAAAPDLLERAHSWVANREVEGRAGRRAAVSPASGRPFAETTLLDAAQAGGAVEAARRALPAWSRRTLPQRGPVLRRAPDLFLDEGGEIAPLIARQQGQAAGEAAPVDGGP